MGTLVTGETPCFTVSKDKTTTSSAVKVRTSGRALPRSVMKVSSAGLRCDMGTRRYSSDICIERSKYRTRTSHRIAPRRRSAAGCDIVHCSAVVGDKQTNGPTEEDRQYMQQAIELARTAEGKTFPNPIVGCVIVKDGVVVGTGYHPKAGEPHAEVFALRAAGEKAKGATAYVSLEPCNHYGRTPPCSQAMVDSGVSRVVVGMVDPNPKVGGSGIKTLEDAGIQVTHIGGDEEALCKEINAEFLVRITQ